MTSFPKTCAGGSDLSTTSASIEGCSSCSTWIKTKKDGWKATSFVRGSDVRESSEEWRRRGTAVVRRAWGKGTDSRGCRDESSNFVEDGMVMMKEGKLFRRFLLIHNPNTVSVTVRSVILVMGGYAVLR